MNSERSAWRLEEWRDHAKHMERQYLNALEGWGVTVKELESCSQRITQQQEQVRSLLSQRQAESELRGLIAGLVMAKPAKNGKTRARQQKNDPAALLGGYRILKARYVEAHGPVQFPSVKAVLKWAFEREFERANVGVWRVSSEEFQVKLRSLEKRISEARTQMRVKFPKR